MIAPICHKCHLTMETASRTEREIAFACPLCRAETTIDIAPTPMRVPKCGICGRPTVPQGEVFCCPHCRTIWDGIDERITTASYDPTRRLEREENRRLRHPAHHRGGSFERWTRNKLREI